MRELKNCLASEVEFYQKMMDEAERKLKQFADKEPDPAEPKRRVHVDNRKGSSQYYLITKDPLSGKDKKEYIPQKEREKAGVIIQREYYAKVSDTIQRQLAALKKFADHYDEDAVLKLYERIHPAKRSFIKSVILPDEEYAAKWQSETYVGKPFSDDLPFFLTERGEKVRSKSEKIIADKLFSMNIPYKYECPLELKRKTVIYPDFKALNIRTRKTYYLEHFGMMDDPQYTSNFMKKIYLYEENGIFPGESLIFTMETRETPLRKVDLDRLIRKYLI